MTKKQLQFLVVTLAILLVIVLFLPTGTPEQPAGEVLPEATAAIELQEEQVPEEVVEKSVEEGEADAASDVQEQVIIEGTFLSLVDGENDHGKTFKYMLLDDGSEVLRIDLRTVIGYSEIDVIEKLGVERGDAVRVIGVLKEGKFRTHSIAPQ